jgi:ankyrin repeat protein
VTKQSGAFYMDNELTYFYLIKDGNLEGLRSAFNDNVNACHLMPYGQTLALHAVLENQIEILRFLIERGADLNKGDDDGFTPLHAAALENNINATEIILEAGANVEIVDNYGNTPLSKAVYSYRDDLSVISLLLKYGADPFHKNKGGISPYEFAEKTRKIDVLDLFRKGQTVP